MKQLVINKSYLKHNIKAIQNFARESLSDSKEDKYTIIGVVKGNRVWT